MVFADTFYWIATTNPSDRYSQAAKQFDHFFLTGPVYTTEEVLTEFLAFFAGEMWLRNRAAKTVREILSDPAVVVIPKLITRLHQGWIFMKRARTKATA